MTANNSSTCSNRGLPALHLTDEERNIVVTLLARHLPGREVWAFGSRVSGRNLKPHSDLDLAILGPARVATADLDQLLTAFAESDLPFRVDLVDMMDADGTFRRSIETERAVLTRG